MEEVDEQGQRDDRQNHGERDGQPGQLDITIHIMDLAEYQDTVEEVRNKGPENELIAGIPHEVAEQPWSVLFQPRSKMPPGLSRR